MVKRLKRLHQLARNFKHRDLISSRVSTRKRFHPDVQRDPKSKRLSDWIVAITATVALIVSIGVAYIQFFRVQESLRLQIFNPMVIGHHKSTAVDAGMWPTDLDFVYTVNLKLTLHNDGNRPVTFSKIDAVYLTKRGDGKFTLPLIFENDSAIPPIILSPGEARLMNVSVKIHRNIVNILAQLGITSPSRTANGIQTYQVGLEAQAIDSKGQSHSMTTPFFLLIDFDGKEVKGYAFEGGTKSLGFLVFGK